MSCCRVFLRLNVVYCSEFKGSVFPGLNSDQRKEKFEPRLNPGSNPPQTLMAGKEGARKWFVFCPAKACMRRAFSDNWRPRENA